MYDFTNPSIHDDAKAASIWKHYAGPMAGSALTVAR